MFVLTQRVSGKGFKRNTPAGGKLKQARFVFFKGDAANRFQRQRIELLRLKLTRQQRRQ